MHTETKVYFSHFSQVFQIVQVIVVNESRIWTECFIVVCICYISVSLDFIYWVGLEYLGSFWYPLQSAPYCVLCRIWGIVFIKAWMFLILFYSVYDTKVGILNKQNKLLVYHKLLPGHQYWLHQVWRKMFFPKTWWYCWGKFYSVEVLWCNLILFCVLAGGIANIIIYLFLIVLWQMLLSLGQMFWGSLLFVIIVHDVIKPCGFHITRCHRITLDVIEPCGCQVTST